MAKTISAVKTITLQQAAQLVQLCGENVTVYVKGEPGCGKTSLLKMQAEQNGDAWRKVGAYHPKDKYQYIYVDCPLIDLPDFAMPYVAEGVTHYAPSALWGFTDARPKIIMFDEVSKAPNVTKPMFTRAMLERCIGEFPFPAGTKVFATGNYASDGVGDSMQGHINNRVMTVSVGKPDSEAWIEWAINNNVNPMIILGVKQYPQILQSYMEFPENEYIFNPKKNTGAFVTPRSLEKAGHVCDNREAFGADLTLEALKGVVGISFAEDLLAYFSVADSVPSWEAIEKRPEDTPVPKSPAAQLLLIYGSILRVNKKNAEIYTKYFFRFDLELRMLWARQFKNRLEQIMGVEAFRKMLITDSWVFN